MRLSLLWIASTAFLACATTPPVQPAGSVKPVVLGLTRPIGQQAAKSGARELAAYLTGKLGQPVNSKVYETGDLLAAALAHRLIDAAWMTPGVYVRATALDPGIQPILKLSRGGATRYRSAFFAVMGNGGALASFRGKRLALVAPESMSGRLYPLAYLKKLGIDAKTFFGSILVAPDHKRVCEMVLDGEADVGATFSDDRGSIYATADGCREAGFDPAKFAVIAVSGAVPNDVIAVRAGLSQEIVEHLKRVLSDMSSDDVGRAKMRDIFRADGFVPALDSDFKDVRDLERFVSAK